MSKTAEKIKSLRLKHKMSLTDLSEKINLSRTLISAWENDYRSLTIEHAITLCDVFNIPYVELISCMIVDVKKEKTA